MPNHPADPFQKVSSTETTVDRYKWKAMATVALSTIMATMDASITNLSFPILTHVFGVSITTIVWVALAYVLTGTSLVLFFGRVGDLFGRKRLYIGGAAFSIFGLILCSLSQNVGQLIAYRVIQGIGSAMTMACGAAIITEAFPQKERGLGLGLMALSVSIGFVTGPILGGFLLGWLDWRSIFYARIPLGLIVLVMTVVCLKKDSKRVDKIKFDWGGTAFSSAGLACLMFGVNQLNRFGPESSIFYVLMGSGVLCFVIFVFIEKKAANPVVRLSLFKNRVFSSGLAALFLMFLTYSTFTLLMPFYLLQGIGMTPARAGMMMTIVSITAMIVGPVSGSLSDRFGQARFATVGSIVTVISFGLMVGLDLQGRMIDIIPALALFGFGMGMFQSPNNSAIMGSVSASWLGTAAAIVSTARQAGISLGTALAGTIFSAQYVFHQAQQTKTGFPAEMIDKQALMLSFSDTFLISTILMSSVVLLSLVTRRSKKPED